MRTRVFALRTQELAPRAGLAFANYIAGYTIFGFVRRFQVPLYQAKMFCSFLSFRWTENKSDSVRAVRPLCARFGSSADESLILLFADVFFSSVATANKKHRLPEEYRGIPKSTFFATEKRI